MIFVLYVCTFCYFFDVGFYSVEDEQALMYKDVVLFHSEEVLIQGKNTMLINILGSNIKFVVFNYLGVVTFGINPILSIFKSAGVFGFISGSSVMTNGAYFCIAHTLPHSFELIPVILSAADGMYLGVNVWLNIIMATKKELELSFFLKRLCVYLLLIVLAAFIEVFISMEI